jgi:hypothetical protein
MKTKLIIYVWRHAILHVASFVHIIQQPISFVFVFFIVLYIVLLHPHNAIQWVLNVDLIYIYIGLYSPSIIRYLKFLTSDIFKSPFEDCHFNKIVFPPLGGE